MQHCPQCDFIYEDDQRFCDMDGKELVHDGAPVVTQAKVADPLSPTPKRVAGGRSIGLAVAIVVGVLLIALGSAAYFARASQTAPDAPSSVQSPSGNTGAQPQTSDPVTTQSPAADPVAAEQTAEQSLEELPEQSSSQTDAAPPDPSSKSSEPGVALVRARLAANPVSTRVPSSNIRGPVIVRLNKGIAIKADEAWEKKEGVWYRQEGMVTDLKRSSVRSIERPASQSVPSKSANGKTGTANRLPIARLEPADPKKPSRVTSFLKKTGRILKRPFKF